MFVLPDDIPVLDIGNRQGYTDYIDFLTLEEVTSPVMKGVDMFNRPFVVVKFNVTKPDEVDLELMETFFQRYTIPTNLYQGCGHATPLVFETSGGMSHEQFDAVERIIAGEELILTEDLRCSYDLVNSKIKLSK